MVHIHRSSSSDTITLIHKRRGMQLEQFIFIFEFYSGDNLTIFIVLNSIQICGHYNYKVSLWYEDSGRLDDGVETFI